MNFIQKFWDNFIGTKKVDKVKVVTAKKVTKKRNKPVKITTDNIGE
jgi:hypothetical protein|tara:strand:+ start:26 stop:163 length:138 start_codon:yes stop_codon:yes gene_type:complete